MAEDRRRPRRPFDPALVRGALGGRDIRSVAYLHSGKSNSNYKIKLDDGRTYVVRLRSAGDAAREAYVMGLARELVPVPVEAARGEGWSVFEFMEGEMLESAPQYASKAAEALGRIGSVRFASAGWIEADGSVSAMPFGGMRGFVLRMVGSPVVQGWLGRELLEGLSQLLAQEAGRIDSLAGDSRLVHGDFNPRNVLIRDGMVSGVLDWEFSHAGSVYEDVGNLLRHLPDRWEEIGAGLEAGGMALPGDWRERAALVDLTSHLEFLTSGRSDAFKRECVGRVRGTVERFAARG